MAREFAVKVCYFAQLRDALKCSFEVLNVLLPVTESQFLEHLGSLHPRQKSLFLASRLAVNDAYLEDNALLNPSDTIPAIGIDLTVDIISPISGG